MVLRITLWAWLTVLAAGCATHGGLSDSESERLTARVEARWAALESSDWAAAYRFRSPAYREVFSESMYAKRFYGMVRWQLTSVEILNYDAGAAVASVAVRVMTEPVKPTSAASEAIGAVPITSVEQWVMSDGQWWYSADL
jgi:hypothetical protein